MLDLNPNSIQPGGVVNALLVHLLVLLHPSTMRLARHPLRRVVDVRHVCKLKLVIGV